MHSNWQFSLARLLIAVALVAGGMALFQFVGAIGPILAVGFCGGAVGAAVGCLRQEPFEIAIGFFVGVCAALVAMFLIFSTGWFTAPR